MKLNLSIFFEKKESIWALLLPVPPVQDECEGHSGAHLRDHPHHGGHHTGDWQHCPGHSEISMLWDFLESSVIFHPEWQVQVAPKSKGCIYESCNARYGKCQGFGISSKKVEGEDHMGNLEFTSFATFMLNILQVRTSYLPNEILWGHRFDLYIYNIYHTIW